MLKRSLGLYAKYLIAKIKYRKEVNFKGFTICYNFPHSTIEFSGG